MVITGDVFISSLHKAIASWFPIGQRDTAKYFIEASFFAAQFSNGPALVEHQPAKRSGEIVSRRVGIGFRKNANTKRRFGDNHRFLDSRKIINFPSYRRGAAIKRAISISQGKRHRSRSLGALLQFAWGPVGDDFAAIDDDRP